MSRSTPTSLPDLPIEVIIRIFHLLDVYDLHAVSFLNKTCHAIYKQHLELDFAMKSAGVVNESREVNSDEKLRALARREENWRTLDTSRVVTVRIPHFPSNLYDLSAGFYVLGDVVGNTFYDFIEKRTLSLRYADLSKYEADASGRTDVEEEDENEDFAHWKANAEKWGIMKAEGVIVDFGLCIDEHDLLGLVEVAQSPGECPIKLRLCQFSTGAPHPSAAKPSIDLGVTRETWGKLSVMMETVGPYLLLLLNWNTHEEDLTIGPRDRLLLFNWYSGEMLVEEQSRRDVWDGLTFLSPHIFILTNMELGCLDVIHILQNLPDPSSKQPRTSFTRLMSFMLPQPVPDLFYYNISCRSDPNPFGIQPDGTPSLGTERSRHRFFANDAEKAIVIFRLLLTARPGLIRFSFVVHRSTLLRHVHEAHPWILFNSNPPQEMPNSPAMNWDDWGTTSTRWIFDDTFHTPWITTTAGQREVFLRGEPEHIVVRDYNSVIVRRAMWEEKNGSFDDMDGRRTLITDSEPLASWEHVFTSKGEHSLPCVEVESQEEFGYDGVLMDENHLLGLDRSEDSSELVSFDVFTL